MHSINDFRSHFAKTNSKIKLVLLITTKEQRELYQKHKGYQGHHSSGKHP